MAPSDSIDALIAAVLLALAHVFVTRLRHVTGSARNALLMAGAGVSLSYVLLYILPQLASKQDIMLASTKPGLLGVMENHVYAMALIGLVIYFGIAQFSAGGVELRTTASVLRYRAALIATVFAYGAYSILVGYIMVHSLNVELIAMVLFTFAMATYFMISDYGLRRKWPDAYDKVIRWILAVSVLIGWALGVATEISENVKVLWFSFLAGVVLIDTIGEKLPRQAAGSFWAFLAGVLGFGVLVFITRLTA